MADLIAEHFSRDLSEAEENELAQLIKDSPQEAERFAELAAQDWKHLGLAEPVLRRLKLPKPMHALGGLALAAVAAFAALHEAPQAPQPRSIEQTIVYTRFGEHKGASGPAQLPGEQLQVIARPGTDKIFTLQLLHPKAIIQSADVYDEEGHRVSALKSTDTREWGWSWNGRNSQGSLAKPGRYELRLQRENGKLSRWVQVEVR